MANFKAVGALPDDLTWYQKKKFFRDAKYFVWDDPYLFKIGENNLLRRCVTQGEVRSMLWHFHSSPYGGLYNGERTIVKVLQSSFYWPTLCKDAHNYVGGFSRRNEMPLQSILEVKAFDCWGIDFIGPFPLSYSYEYILWAVDYVTKWVEAVVVQHADAKTVIRFLTKNIFSRFGTPRVLISDGRSHFCNAQHYSVKRKVASPYHPQTNGQVEVSNKEVKKILEKEVAQSSKDWSLKLDEALRVYSP